jgi:hypothetical protein
LVEEAEFALAREQLKTQTPLPPAQGEMRNDEREARVREASYGQPLAESMPARGPDGGLSQDLADSGLIPAELPEAPSILPEDWPDPRGFIPPAPLAERPVCKPHYGPIISQVRQYDGADSNFTEALAGYFYFRDDARFGGWQAYLQRKDDFCRFCCYMHISEMLAARGGVDETRVAIRWPVGRYQN